MSLGNVTASFDGVHQRAGRLQRRHFLLGLTLLAVVSTPAWAQAVSPTTGAAGSGPRSAASIPDFSGVWAHPYLTGFEPPASGPGPVRNRSRRPDGVANFNQLVGDYTNPILRPWAADVVKKHGQISSAGQGYPLPIRVLPTPPRCRVLPGTGVKLRIGRCGNAARDAEQ